MPFSCVILNELDGSCVILNELDVSCVILSGAKDLTKSQKEFAMEKRNIKFSPPDITEEEIAAVGEALRSGWITTGPRTKELEKNLKEYTGAAGCVCLNSATASEELNLRVAGIGEGDEVIVPAYTYTASASAVLHTGATLRFIDICKDRPELDYDALEGMINERTKAVIPVDLGGVPCDYDRIRDILDNKKSLFSPKGKLQEAKGRVLIIADGAHSLGAYRNTASGKKMAGSLADMTSFSFHAVKNFTTAEGGASMWMPFSGVDDEELYHEYQLYSLHGQSKDALAKTKLGAWEYDIEGAYYKCNMTDMAAAIGLVQFKRYPGLLEKRRGLIERYDALCEEKGIEHLVHFTDEYSSSGHLYLTRLPGFDDEKRREFIIKLAEKGVTSNVHYKPLPMMTAYKKLGFDIKDFPNAYHYYENEVTLPLHTLLTDEDMEYICAVVREAL